MDSASGGTSSSASHPRRPPAHRSVSLRHTNRSSRAKSHGAETGPVTMPPAEPIKRPSSSPSSLKPLVGKDDSGESSNAEKWFEKSNNHASRNSTSYVDNSPPFFLQNSSSEDTAPEAVMARQRNQMLNVPTSTGSLPHYTNLLQLGTDNSSTEDFRSVIDDLTIENKKLKRKLWSYEKLQDSHLKDQKLFEVRVHGLPTAKKRELEDMLRKFAMGLGPQPATEQQSNLYASLNPQLVHNKSQSSSASNAFADSAYQSASASGQGSSNSDSRRKGSSVNAARSRHQNIQTYLHDIPEGLLPRQPSAMSEKARKKLVVRRMEQIFAGKGAMKGGNQQPQQQQEVSQQAATIERRALEEDGHKAPREGVREALIMSQQKDESNAQDAQSRNKPSPKRKLEQRPTRPLDLDPYRAQVPTENIDYIRHLGFSPPGAEQMEPQQDGHGWIYINLLANMAQIHTLNVTSDFIRKAVQDYSQKFELSSDGRKVRWKGGKSVTRTSTDGEETPSIGNSGSLTVLSDRGSPRKRIKISQNGGSSSSSGQPGREMSTGGPDNKLAYTPLFAHRTEDDTDTSSSDGEDTNESAFPFPVAGDSSGMTSSGIKTTSTKKNKKRENGPIIFYNNARFCTDLSGDNKNEEAMMYNAYLYHNVTQTPIGTAVSGGTSPAGSAGRGPLTTASDLPEAMDLDDNPIPRNLELQFPPAESIKSESAKARNAYQFEVSGLGGVCPADNFAINVESLHAPVDDTSAPAETRSGQPPQYPSRIASVLQENQDRTGRRGRQAFHKQILTARHEDLPPSRLPDASCFMSAGDTSPEDDETLSDAEDAMSVDAHSPDAPGPAAAPQRLDLDYTSSDESEEESDDDDESSYSGSVDLLATARKIDPEAIRAREREYDANLAERLAEEIPAGSSAATAGGGSGFASPGSGVDKEEWEAAKKDAIKARREAKEAKEAKGEKRRRSETSGSKDRIITV